MQYTAGSKKPRTMIRGYKGIAFLQPQVGAPDMFILQHIYATTE